MTKPAADITPKRLAPGLYQVGPVAVSRECEDRSCGCDRYAIRTHFGDPLAEMGYWITARRLLKDALVVAQNYATWVAN